MKKIVVVILLLIVVTLLLIPPVLADNSISAIASTSGTPQVGSTLTAGALTPSGATATYLWQESATSSGTYTPILGAISTTYTPVAGDVGQYIEVVATGTGSYNGTATSAPVGPVAAATTPITAIGATTYTNLNVGSTLTAGALTPLGATATYLWQKSTTSGGTYTPISGATSTTYTPVAGDVGQYIEVVATGTGSYTGTVTSAAVGPVTALVAPVAAFTGTPTSGPAPLTVQFTDHSTNTSPISWYWVFGDGGTSTQENPSYTYVSAITSPYTVTLIISSPAGPSTSTIPSYISVSPNVTTPTPTPTTIPVPSFSSSVTSGTAPLFVQFTDTSTNSPTTWNWSFGDGNSSTLQSPSFTYTIPGTWTVSLTATNSYGSNTTTETGYITVSSSTSAPVASFIGSPTLGTAPLTVQFNDTSSGSPTSWLWSFGDGSSSTDQNPSYTYIIPGSYTVSLTATNAVNGNISTYENYITVSQEIIQTQTPVPTLATPIPTPTPQKVIAAFTGTPTSGNSPLIVQFTDSSTGSPTSWSWDFGDGGTSSQRNPSYTYTFPGDYTVILTVKNAGGGGVLTKTSYIAVNAAPTPTPISPFTTLGALGGAVMISSLLIGRKKH